MSTEPSLLFERRGPTVVLTMNRPERRNALSLDMIVRMADAWDAVEADDTVRSVILTGAAGAYCVGGDMDAGWMGGKKAASPTEHEQRAQADMSIVGRGLLLTRWLRKPIVAVVNGEFYKTWKDLDGQDIAVHARGSGTEAVMLLMAKKHGITYGNIS